MNKLESIAAFLIFLIVSIPLYSSSVYATINSASAKGSSGFEGIIKPKDSILFTANVRIAGDSSISQNQVRLGNNNFERCIVTQNNETECTKRQGGNTSSFA